MSRDEGAEQAAQQPPEVRIREIADRARALAGELLETVAALDTLSRDLAEKHRRPRPAPSDHRGGRMPPRTMTEEERRQRLARLTGRRQPRG